MRTTISPPITVAVVNDYELIVHGVVAMLRQHPGHVRVVDQILIGEAIEADRVDVALFDVYGRVGVVDEPLRRLLDDPRIRHVALFSLSFDEALLQEARALGVTGFISKRLTGERIVAAIVDVAAGIDVRAEASTRRPVPSILEWPGRDDGLTERESQVLVLMAQGCTNREIAALLHIGVETVKSHARNLFRKLSFRNRSQASGYVERSGAFNRYQPAQSGIGPPQRGVPVS